MITKDWSISDIVEQYPQTAQILMDHGMHCFGCMAARFENIEEGALAHGINVDQLMEDLNKAANA